MIHITEGIRLQDEEIEETFARSSGPGGQNVNKVETSVQLRFHVRSSPNLPPDVRERLEHLAGRRVTKAGVLVITARRFRTRERNRADAFARLIELVRAAATAPAERRATMPPPASKLNRLEQKHRRANLKRLRRAQYEEA